MAASPGAILLALTPQTKQPFLVCLMIQALLVCPMMASAAAASINSLRREDCPQGGDKVHFPVALRTRWANRFVTPIAHSVARLRHGLDLCKANTKSNLIRGRIIVCR